MFEKIMNKETKPEWCHDCKFVIYKLQNIAFYTVTNKEPFESEYAGRRTVPMEYCLKSKKFIPSGFNPPRWCQL